MANEVQETKKCKHCQSDIPKKAKVCPVCKKKQGGGILKWVIIIVVVLVILVSLAGGGGSDSNVKKTGEVSNTGGNSGQTSDGTAQEEHSNVFHVGDIVETSDFRITFVSFGVYKSDNQFLQPKDGYEYMRFEFKFENISNSDKVVSSLMDWECYADNTKVDQSYIGDDNGLDATLSAGRQTQGSVYFEVPKNAKTVELEYDINYWKSDKIIFVGKE